MQPNWKLTPLIVGTITTVAGLKKLSKTPSLADLAEVRVDALLQAGLNLEKILDLMRLRQTPVLLTLRTEEEGGVYPWTKDEREAIFTALLPDVEAIDVELASLKDLERVVKSAKKLKKKIILSAHAIPQVPSPAQLRSWIQGMLHSKPDIAKLAVRLENRADLRGLSQILFQYPQQRWALMGLGQLAPLSRVVLGSIGSSLVYGYLDKPAAVGQPSVKELRHFFQE